MIGFMNSNPAFKYPIYDNHIIEISLAFLLLKYAGRNKDLRVIIEYIINAMKIKYYMEKKHPVPYVTYEEAPQIHFGEKIEYTASILFAGLLEWACIEDAQRLLMNWCLLSNLNSPPQLSKLGK